MRMPGPPVAMITALRSSLLSHRIGGERQVGGVFADASVVFDHPRGVLRHRVCQLASPVMTMNMATDGVTRLDVREPGVSGFDGSASSTAGLLQPRQRVGPAESSVAEIAANAS